MGTTQEKLTGKEKLQILAHGSVEGYCSAAILVALCHAQGRPYHMFFSDTMDIENHISLGHPDAEIQTSEKAYELVSKMQSSLTSTAIYPLLATLAKRKEVDNTHVQDALAAGKLLTRVGINVHGCNRPLLSMLEHSLHPWFGGSKEASKEILKNAQIQPFLGEEQKTLQHLTDEELGRLREVLEPITGQFINQSYILPNRKGDLSCARECAMALLACEALGEHSTAVGVLLGDSVCQDRAISLMEEYRKEVRRFMQRAQELKQHKPFHFLSIEKIKPKVVQHYFSSVECNGPLLAAVPYNPVESLWLFKGEDHKKVLEQLGHHAKVSIQQHTHYSLCHIPKDKEGEMLEYFENLLKKQSMEETIA